MEQASSNGPLARLLKWLGGKRWFAALGRRLSPIDAWLYARSDGRISVTGRGGTLYPTLLLTTTGRKTGNRRTTPVMFVRDGDSLVVSCENFGQERPAAWPLNLDADPRAAVQIGAETIDCVARSASAEEVQRYWPRFVEIWPAHEKYLGRSGVRRMFVLEAAS